MIKLNLYFIGCYKRLHIYSEYFRSAHYLYHLPKLEICEICFSKLYNTVFEYSYFCLLRSGYISSKLRSKIIDFKYDCIFYRNNHPSQHQTSELMNLRNNKSMSIPKSKQFCRLINMYWYPNIKIEITLCDILS